MMAEDPFLELRMGFTAAVSHELRTPLARLLALLDTASLPGEDTGELLDKARVEVLQMTEPFVAALDPAVLLPPV